MIRKLIDKFTDSGKSSPAVQPASKTDDIIDHLPGDVRQKYNSNVTYLKNMFIDARADRLAISLIKRFLEFVWDLPAAESHHHARPFGLFTHSLETAAANIKDFENKLFFQFRDGSIDSYKTRTVKPREQYAYFLTGLLYDIGEASKYSISTVNTSPESRKTDLIVQYLHEAINDIPQDANTQEKFNDLMTGMPDIVTSALDMLINDKDPDSGDNEVTCVQVAEQMREIYSHVIAGLLHDVGKAAETIVSSGENVWCPIKEGLYTFYKRNNGEITKKYIEGKTYALHQRMGPVYAARIVNHNDYNYIGTQNFAEIMDYFANQSMGNRFKKTTIEADMQSTADDIQETSSSNIAVLLLETIRNIASSGKYPCNTPMPGMWILEDHTAIADSILEEARITLQNNGKRIDKKILLKTLVDKKYVKVEDGWRALYQMTIDTQGRPFQQRVVQFKNNILWKDVTKPAMCTLRLKFNSLELSKK